MKCMDCQKENERAVCDECAQKPITHPCEMCGARLPGGYDGERFCESCKDGPLLRGALAPK